MSPCYYVHQTRLLLWLLLLLLLQRQLQQLTLTNARSVRTTVVIMPHVPTLLVVSIVHVIPVLLTLSAMEHNVMVRNHQLCRIPLYYFLDVNECTAGTDNCSDDAACTNLSGSFRCACNSGFSDTLSDGTQCDGKKRTTMTNFVVRIFRYQRMYSRHR